MTSRFKRRPPTRKYRKTVWIFCNGHTERLYFSDFRDDLNISSVQIIAESSEYNRISLVKQVRQRGLIPSEDTEVWVVFDVDDDPGGQTNDAVALCDRLGYKAIVSNECFEVWLRLHFEYFDSALHRNALFDWMGQRFNCRYEKNKRIPTYPQLKHTLATAIRNARRLAETYAEKTPLARRNPYTNVHELAEALIALQNEYARK